MLLTNESETKNSSDSLLSQRLREKKHIDAFFSSESAFGLEPDAPRPKIFSFRFGFVGGGFLWERRKSSRSLTLSLRSVQKESKRKALLLIQFVGYPQRRNRWRVVFGIIQGVMYLGIRYNIEKLIFFLFIYKILRNMRDKVSKPIKDFKFVKKNVLNPWIFEIQGVRVFKILIIH